jgi:hypothetical protein
VARELAAAASTWRRLLTDPGLVKSSV